MDIAAPRGINRRRAILASVVVVAVVALWWVCSGRASLALGDRYQPLYATVSATDPTILYVTIAWPHDGYCSGEFHVDVIESKDEIRVEDVIDPLQFIPGGACAGLGSMGYASASVVLDSPVGNRWIVRDSDGAVLGPAPR